MVSALGTSVRWNMREYTRLKPLLDRDAGGVQVERRGHGRRAGELRGGAFRRPPEPIEQRTAAQGYTHGMERPGRRECTNRCQHPADLRMVA